MPPAAVERESPSATFHLYLYTGLLVLAMGLGLARLVTGPWYHTYNPLDTRLLEGWPVEWEAVYYIFHFPTFLGDALPHEGIAPVHYRTFATLYVATLLYAWTGSAFWSIAAIDLFFWGLAAISVYHVALRLGAQPWAAVFSSFLMVASPLLVSNMWAHVFHISEFATMPLGLWAALVLIDEHHNRWRLAAGLGTLLLLLSLTYQYQWFIAPMLLVLMVGHPRLSAREAIVIVTGAVLLYLISTVAIKGVLVLAGLGTSDSDVYASAVKQPAQLAVARLLEVRSPAQVLLLLPQWSHVRQMAELYHPAIFLAGVAGLCFMPVRALWLALLALAGSLLATTLYSTPWTAMTAFTFIYAGAGVACYRVGSIFGYLVRFTPWLGRHTGRRNVSVWVARAMGLGLVVWLGTLTNRDLVGDTRFLLMWWNAYAGVPLF